MRWRRRTIFNLAKAVNGQDEYGCQKLLEDIDPGEKVYTSQAARFLKALSYTDARKIITLPENGCIPDPDLLTRDQVMWSGWCT